MTRKEDRSVPSHRHNARRNAAQALYQWDITGQSASEIEANFIAEHEFKGVDIDYFREIVREVPAQRADLDEHILAVVDRPMTMIDPVERAVLRIGTWELLHQPSIPWKVVVNESIELAKLFGTDQGYRFVNGVMEKLARLLRTVEIDANAAVDEQG